MMMLAAQDLFKIGSKVADPLVLQEPAKVVVTQPPPPSGRRLAMP